MVFSTNQNRQLYVVDELHPAVGGSDAQGNIFFKYTGAGGVIRTDLIDPKSVTYAKEKRERCVLFACRGFFTSFLDRW